MARGFVNGCEGRGGERSNNLVVVGNEVGEKRDLLHDVVESRFQHGGR